VADGLVVDFDGAHAHGAEFHHLVRLEFDHLGLKGKGGGAAFMLDAPFHLRLPQ
jgi:hypothetical protein